ncbi:MAG: DUF5663 domain-containing protein [Streptosporangiaceae bacterium]
MIKLDADFLNGVGLADLPERDRNLFLKHVYDTLELRVGQRLAKRMSDAQLDEFEVFINRKDDAGAFSWLESNFPDYKSVVKEEFEALSEEITRLAPEIIDGDSEPRRSGKAQS